MAVPRRTTDRDGLGCTATHALRTVTEILPRRHVQAARWRETDLVRCG